MINYIIGGFFVFNGIPHLVKGITGETHMTPFKRVTSPMVNVLWSFFNITAGVYILGYTPSTNADLWAFILGGFLLSLTAAWLFGRPNARLPWHKD